MRSAKSNLPCESIGLVRSLAIQSSNSGGIHLYFPAARDVNTFELAAAVKVTLINAGFDIKAGELELFRMQRNSR